MQIFRYLALLFLTATWLAHSAAAGPADIVGKWRYVYTVKVVDGHPLAPEVKAGHTLVEFKPDGTWWAESPRFDPTRTYRSLDYEIQPLPAVLAQLPVVRSSGTYRWLDAGRLETRVTVSQLSVDMGTWTIRPTAVEEARLTMSATRTRAEWDRYMPPPKPDEHRPETITYRTVFERVTE